MYTRARTHPPTHSRTHTLIHTMHTTNIHTGKLWEDKGEYAKAKEVYTASVEACGHTAGPRVHLAKMLKVCATSQVCVCVCVCVGM